MCHPMGSSCSDTDLTKHLTQIKWSDPKDLINYCFSAVRIIL